MAYQLFGAKFLDAQLWWLVAVPIASWLVSRLAERDYYVVVRRHYNRQGYAPFLSKPADYFVEVFDDLVAAQVYATIHETDYLGVLERAESAMEVTIQVMACTDRKSTKGQVLKALANPKKDFSLTGRVVYQTSHREIERRRKHWAVQSAEYPERIGPPPSGC